MAGLLLLEFTVAGDVNQLEVLLRINGAEIINYQDSDFEGKSALHWGSAKGLGILILEISHIFSYIYFLFINSSMTSFK